MWFEVLCWYTFGLRSILIREPMRYISDHLSNAVVTTELVFRSELLINDYSNPRFFKYKIINQTLSGCTLCWVFMYISCIFRFYPRWKEYESMQAKSLHFSLDESQWRRDWELLLSLASQPGRSDHVSRFVTYHHFICYGLCSFFFFILISTSSFFKEQDVAPR